MDPVRCHSPSSLSLSLFLSQFSLSLSSFIDNIDDDKQDDTINNNDNNNNNNEDDDDDDDDDDGERGETNSKLRRRPAPPPPPPHRPIVPSSRFWIANAKCVDVDGVAVITHRRRRHHLRFGFFFNFSFFFAEKFVLVLRWKGSTPLNFESDSSRPIWFQVFFFCMEKPPRPISAVMAQSNDDAVQITDWTSMTWPSCGPFACRFLFSTRISRPIGRRVFGSSFDRLVVVWFWSMDFDFGIAESNRPTVDGNESFISQSEGGSGARLTIESDVWRNNKTEKGAPVP